MILTAFHASNIVAQHPTLLYAGWISIAELGVYQSVAIKDSHEFMAPIKKMLNKFNYHVSSSTEVEDEHMMFGRALETVYELSERKDQAIV